MLYSGVKYNVKHSDKLNKNKQTNKKEFQTSAGKCFFSQESINDS